MNNIKLIFKGFIVGLGKIIPGVSGGMLAILLGVYEQSVQAIAHFFRDWKKNIIFLSCLGIGVIGAIVLMSGVIEFSLEHFYLPTMLLFIGLMLGGFSSLKREVEGTNYKKYLPHLLIPFFLMILFSFSQKGNFILYDKNGPLMIFLFGVIDAITMVVPGISGTAILMLLGFYPMLLDTFSHLFDLDYLNSTIQIMGPFGFGIIIGTILTIKIVSYLLEKHTISFHYTIISFFLSSILLLALETFKHNYSVGIVLLSFVFFFIGNFISKFFSKNYDF